MADEYDRLKKLSRSRKKFETALENSLPTAAV
jgi:hypothetical protein